MKTGRLLAVFAGLCGASGVALSALAAHRADLPNLGTAANMLLFHAPAFLALSMLTTGRLRQAAVAVLALGVLLFCGDLVARATIGARLFPMAAPTGGLLMIAGWLLVAASGFVHSARGGKPGS